VSFNAEENLEKTIEGGIKKSAKYHCKKFGKAITATSVMAHARRPNFHNISGHGSSRRRKSEAGGQGAQLQQMMHQPGKHMMSMMH
jgi:hypothetical protein